jgi:hypothetical protein
MGRHLFIMKSSDAKREQIHLALGADCHFHYRVT